MQYIHIILCVPGIMRQRKGLSLSGSTRIPIIDISIILNYYIMILLSLNYYILKRNKIMIMIKSLDRLIRLCVHSAAAAAAETSSCRFRA